MTTLLLALVVLGTILLAGPGWAAVELGGLLVYALAAAASRA